MHSTRLLAVIVPFIASAAFAASEPVQTYTADPIPSRSEGLRSVRPFIPAADPRAGLLITPAPFPAAHVDSPSRLENGRLWIARSPVGNRTPVNEIVRGVPGAGSYGAAPELLDELVFVQPTERRAVIGVSPWQTIDADIYRQVQRLDPNLPRNPDAPRAARLVNELRAGQHQWLEERGYILNVRTHINPAPLSPDRSVDAGAIKPRGVIRVVPTAPKNSPARMAAAE